jgi:hypothetical protein
MIGTARGSSVVPPVVLDHRLWKTGSHKQRVAQLGIQDSDASRMVKL